MNAHTPCDCNYCEEVNKRVLMHEELVEALERAKHYLDLRAVNVNDETYKIVLKTLDKAKEA